MDIPNNNENTTRNIHTERTIHINIQTNKTRKSHNTINIHILTTHIRQVRIIKRSECQRNKFGHTYQKKLKEM